MSHNSGKKFGIFRRVTVRLTLLHLGLFALASLIVFLLIYVSLASALRSRTDRNLNNEVREFESLVNLKGLTSLEKEFVNESRSNGIGSWFYLFLSPHLRVIASSDLRPWKGVKFRPPPIRKLQEGEELITTSPHPGHPHKVRIIYKRVKGGNILIVGHSLKANDEILKRTGEIFQYGFIAMLIMGGLLGWLVSRHAMSGVQRITDTARRIERGNLSWRVPVGKEGQEIEELARAFNSMLDRIELLVTDLEEVTNNIAHDLRNPLTRIRGSAESLLARSPHPDSVEEMAGIIVESCDQLLGLIHTMLTIAQADSGLSSPPRERIDMETIARDMVDLFQPAAGDKGILLNIRHAEDIPPGRGDPLSLKRVIANLLDNAIKFSGTGDTITLSMGLEEKRVFLEVKDTGMGIEERDLPHIFDRFYRGDKSRSQPGNGLGLSLALALIRAQDGEITVTSVLGKGTTFRVYLPIFPGPSSHVSAPSSL